MNRELDVIGVPSSMGAFAPGQERAPTALREAGLVDAIREAGVAVRDLADPPVRRWRPDRSRPDAQNVGDVVEVAKDTAARVEQSAGDGKIALVLGGDCTVGLGTVAGHRRSDLAVCLVYFDLHPDMNVPSSVREGALDWMGMAHALDLNGAIPALVNLNEQIPLMEPADLVFFAYGERNRTAFEAEQMHALGLTGITVREVAEAPEGAASRAREILEPQAERLLVHLDVDVIDFTDLPLSENAGRNEGLSFDQTVAALRVLVASPSFAGLTVSEVNPDHDPDGTALSRLVRGLADALSKAPVLADGHP
jgi:arginase